MYNGTEGGKATLFAVGSNCWLLVDPSAANAVVVTGKKGRGWVLTSFPLEVDTVTKEAQQVLEAAVALILLVTLVVVRPREDSMVFRTLQGAKRSSPINRTDSHFLTLGGDVRIPCMFQIKNDLCNFAVTKVTEFLVGGEKVDGSKRSLKGVALIFLPNPRKQKSPKKGFFCGLQ